MKIVDFYLDFSSPYAYIAANIVDEFAAKHGARMNWLPFVLGAVFKDEGTRPLMEYPKKGAYSKIDILRSAKYHQVTYNHPTPFPVGTITALRVFYAIRSLEGNKGGEEAAKAYAKLVFKSYFIDGKDISSPQMAIEIAGQLGHEPDLIASRIQDAGVKAELKAVTDHAIGRGVFGAPFFYVGDEPFWGVDRLEMLAHYLKKGSW